MRSSGPSTAHLWGVALAGWFVVGLGAPLLDMAIRGELASLGQWRLWLSFLAYYFLMFVVPGGLPALALGAWRAVRLRRRTPQGQPLTAWALRGVGTGALLGVLGLCAWLGLLFIGSPTEFMKLLPRLVILGAASGATVGFLVALWCWRTTRLLRPRLPC